MIRSGRFSFATIQVSTADNKFSEMGVMGIHRVFENRAVANKFSNLRIIMTGYSSRLIKKKKSTEFISKIKEINLFNLTFLNISAFMTA